MIHPARNTILIISLLAVSSVAWSTTSIEAQDTTEERLAALETRVAEHDDIIARQTHIINGLRSRVTALESDGNTATSDSTAADPAPDPDGLSLRFEGNSDRVTDSFVVAEGVLQISARYSGDSNFIVWIYGPGQTSDLVFNELGAYRGSRVVEVSDGIFVLGVKPGPIFLEIQGIGTWNLTVSQDRS